MKAKVELEQSDFDAMHDVIFEALNYPTEEISNEMIKRYWNKLPEDIKNIAISWGCNDTVFRDDMFTWLQENK